MVNPGSACRPMTDRKALAEARREENCHFQRIPTAVNGDLRGHNMQEKKLSIPCASGQLQVGLAKVDITPPRGTRLWGAYGRRDKEPSEGIADPLYVRVVVLDVSGYRLAIIACDLVGYNNQGISDIARKRFHIPHLFICSSHTHSGPNLGDSDSYARSVEQAMINGLDEAANNMFPARISAGSRSFPQLGYNRLAGRGENKANFRNDDRIPYGPVDPEVGVIKIEDKKGNPRAILIMYACHAVANGVNYEVSADFPGAAARRVDEAFGNNTMSMFIQGGAGDINPLFMSVHRGPNGDPPTDYAQKDKMGAILANEVIKAVESLPAQSNGQTTLKAMSDSLKFTGRFDRKLAYDMHFTTVLINDGIAIATMAAEPFLRFQLFWKERAEVPHPFFFGYTYCAGNNTPVSGHYVPDIRSAVQGGFGADNFDWLIEIGAGEAIMNKHLENLLRLKGYGKADA